MQPAIAEVSREVSSPLGQLTHCPALQPPANFIPFAPPPPTQPREGGDGPTGSNNSIEVIN